MSQTASLRNWLIAGVSGYSVAKNLTVERQREDPDHDPITSNYTEARYGHWGVLLKGDAV